MTARKATRRPKAEPLPNREILDGRLEAQRKRIFQVMGICGLGDIAGHAESMDSQGMRHFAESVWCALQLARDTLNDIAGELDPMVILDPEQEART